MSTKTATAKSRNIKKAITPVIFGELQIAYDQINKDLFKGRLPPCVLQFARKPRSLGYFAPQRWSRGVEGEVVHEIALNPDHLRERGTLDALSTIAHEMVHLDQYVDGTAPKRPYHNADFRDRMEAIGLITSDTEEEGGRRVGAKMSHYIEEGGKFDVAACRMIENGFAFTWSSVPSAEPTKKKKSGGTRDKYTCPDCDTNVWAKPETNIMCGDCEVKMEEAD